MRSVGKIDYKDNNWVIYDLEPHVSIRLKGTFPWIQKGSKGPFYFPDNGDNCVDLDWFLQRYEFQISDELRKRLTSKKNRYWEDYNKKEIILTPDYKSDFEFKLKKPLRDYQRKGVEFFWINRHLLCGDEIGLGKTITSLGAVSNPELRPALIVVQTHLPNQWMEKIEEFLDASVHYIKKTKPYSLPSSDIYITKYSCLSSWVDVLSKGFLKTVIFDEIQELRRSDSQKHNAGKLIAEKAQYVLGLSGTPIYNFGDEIYNILHLIKPMCLGSYNDFAREWCGWSNRVQHPKALGTYLREKHLFLRRTRDEVGMELPAVNKIVHEVGFDEGAVKAVEDIAKQLAIKTTTGSFTERGQAARELDIMVRQMTGVSKAKYVAEYVKMLLENDEPVLLAGWHRDVYDIWLKELSAYNPVMYTGSETPAQKEQAKKDFIDGKSNLMIISLRSGVGLDGLQSRCRTVVFGELDWSPAVMEQVIGRANRDGQKDRVTAIYLVSSEGSDPPMINLLGLKSSQSKDIIDPNSEFGAQYSDESRIQMLAKRYLEKRSTEE